MDSHLKGPVRKLAATSTGHLQASAGHGSSYLNSTSAMMPLKAVCDDVLSAYVSMGAETLRFFQMRAKKDFDLWQDITACKDPMQVYDCQWRFYGKMFDDYMDETARLFSMANQTDDFQVTGGPSEGVATTPLDRSPRRNAA